MTFRRTVPDLLLSKVSCLAPVLWHLIIKPLCFLQGAKPSKTAKGQQIKDRPSSSTVAEAPQRAVEERYVSKQLELEGRPDADTEFQKRLERLRAATAATAEVPTGAMITARYFKTHIYQVPSS